MADGGIQREVRQAIRGRALPAVRSLAWRVLGPPPQPEPSVRRWSDLRRHGLRVEDGLGLYARGTRGITVHFEPPAQLNNATMQMYGKLHIGRYSFMRSGIVRFVREIGRYTSIGPGVVLGEAEHPVHWLTSSPSAYHHGRWLFYPPEVDARDRLIPRDEQTVDMATLQSIEIGHDVWIGAHAIVRRGVRIGDGAVVGAGAFVNRDVPPYAVVGGLPARQIGQRFSDAVIARLMAVRWWEFDISDLAGVDFSDVEGALTDIEAREAAGTITRVPPQFNSVRLKNDGYRSVTVHPDNRTREEARLARITR